MKKLLVFCLLFLALSASAADRITAIVTVTNSPTTNGMTLVVNGSTRTWTNNVVTASSQILTNNSIGGIATNLFNQIAATPFSGPLRLYRSSTNDVRLQGTPGLPMTVTASGNWASITYSTQSVTALTNLSVPLSAWPTQSDATNAASSLVSGLNTFSTTALSAVATISSNLFGRTNSQTISGTNTFIGANIFSNAAQVWVGGTYSGNIGTTTNGLLKTPILSSPITTNLTNYGNAITSPGSAAGAEQFGLNATATAALATAVGNGATASGNASTAFGSTAAASAASTIAVGNGATASKSQAIAIGAIATASETNGIAIGVGSTASHVNSTAVGYLAATTTSNQVVLGSSTANLISSVGRAEFTGGFTNFFTLPGSTNTWSGDLSFTRRDNTSLANGNNAAVDPGTNVHMKVSGPTAAFTINGISRGRESRILIIQNSTGYTMTIANDSGVDPTAANRIYTGTGADVAITNNPSSITLVYDSAVSRWILQTFTGTSIAGVTSVALTAPTAVFDISGSPVTGSGTLAVTFDNQSANTFFAGPASGAATTPAFRSMVTADLPTSAVRTLFAQTNDVTVGNTASETTIKASSGVGSATITANSLSQGSVIRVKASGHISDGGGIGLTVKLKLGGTTIATATLAGGGVSNVGWTMEGLVTVRTTGATGTVVGGGVFVWSSASGNEHFVKTTTTTIDTTAALEVDTSVTWGSAAAANTITCQQYSIDTSKP